MCKGILPLCMSVYHMYALPKKEVLDPLELELQMIVAAMDGR